MQFIKTIFYALLIECQMWNPWMLKTDCTSVSYFLYSESFFPISPLSPIFYCSVKSRFCSIPQHKLEYHFLVSFNPKIFPISTHGFFPTNFKFFIFKFVFTGEFISCCCTVLRFNKCIVMLPLPHTRLLTPKFLHTIFFAINLYFHLQPMITTIVFPFPNCNLNDIKEYANLYI